MRTPEPLGLIPGWLLERSRAAPSYRGIDARSWSTAATVAVPKLRSKSQVSAMAAELDAQVADFRSPPLDEGPYTFVAADALVLKVREGGRVVNVHALVATGVNGDGHREILGLQVTSAEDGAGWLGFFRDLTARDLSGSAS